MRKFAVADNHFFVIWKVIEKIPTVTSFQFATSNLNILLFTLPTLCTPVRVQLTDFHLVDKEFVIGSFEFFSALRSIFRSLGSYPAELYFTNEVLLVFF